ncbi:MAG: hypothetical protein OXU61_05605 [Gammaproteobacteria bacterium]|nr:hypothetical protein [Gammaproteobacteria bacterium]
MGLSAYIIGDFPPFRYPLRAISGIGNRKGRLPPTAAAGAWRLGCCDSPSRGE